MLIYALQVKATHFLEKQFSFNTWTKFELLNVFFFFEDPLKNFLSLISLDSNATYKTALQVKSDSH